VIWKSSNVLLLFNGIGREPEEVLKNRQVSQTERQAASMGGSVGRTENDG
jgi:hypothetical protein